MDPATTPETIANIIRLSVAPVFLLAGIAGFLNVMTSRLARIVDRARVIERQYNLAQPEKQARVQEEVTSLWRRIRLINIAIRACVMSALLVCVVVASLFISDVVIINLSKFIAAMFITAMLMIIAGLVMFLLEVTLSTTRMRHGLIATAPFELEGEDPGPDARS